MGCKLAAIFSGDVKGYSRLMGDDEEATICTLTADREMMTALIQQHRGRVVDSPGHNLLAEFASAVDYVREQEVKNLAKPVRGYRVRWKDGASQKAKGLPNSLVPY